MSQTFYNWYCILSMLTFGVLFIAGVLDEGRNFVDNTMYLFLLVGSLLNVFIMVILGTRTPTK